MHKSKKQSAKFSEMCKERGTVSVVSWLKYMFNSLNICHQHMTHCTNSECTSLQNIAASYYIDNKNLNLKLRQSFEDAIHLGNKKRIKNTTKKVFSRIHMS